jgi:sugar phosphate isomerase/epimerase
MSEPTTVPTLTVNLPPPPQTKWEREYRAFLRLLPELLKTHRGAYVAIHEGQVVDTGDDELALASRVWSKVGYVPIHIGLVTEQPRPIERVPSFREISYE